MDAKFPVKTLLSLSVLILAGCADSHTDTVPPIKSDAPAASADEGANNEQVQKSSTETQAPADNTAVSAVRSAASHSHGGAKLGVVLDKSKVTIELDTPVFNIAGFEHSPKTQAQKDIVAKAEKQLKSGSNLFTFNDSAGCRLVSGPSAVHLFAHDDHDEKEHEGHDDHKDHNDHDSHEGHDDHDEEEHKDILVQYEFLCSAPSKLTSARINLFDSFSNLTELDVTYLSPSAQRAATLTPKSPELDLQP